MSEEREKILNDYVALLSRKLDDARKDAVADARWVKVRLGDMVLSFYVSNVLIKKDGNISVNATDLQIEPPKDVLSGSFKMTTPEDTDVELGLFLRDDNIYEIITQNKGWYERQSD